MKGNFKRKHSCSWCQNKEINQSEWVKHLEKYQKKWQKDYQRENCSVFKGKKINWRIGQRQHSCEWCQSQKLNDQEWKNHLQEFSLKYYQNYHKNLRERWKQQSK